MKKLKAIIFSVEVMKMKEKAKKMSVSILLINEIKENNGGQRK